MEERSINRGEVWWISVDDSVGGEQQTGRPVLVLSSDTLNQKHGVYVVAYMTSSKIAEPCRVPVRVNGLEKRVICNQIRTLDSARFTKYMCTLSNDELTRVLRAMAGVFQIPVSPGKIEYTESDDETIERRVEITEAQVEATMYKRMYEKVLDQLVDLRIEMDMMRRRETAVVEEPEVIEEQPEEVVEPEVIEEPPKILGKAVEINTCEMEDLLGIGVNEDVAIRLIEGRPWKKVEDIRTVDGLTSMMFAVLKEVITVTVAEPPKPVVKAVKDYTWDEFKNLNEKLQLLYLDYHRNTLGEKEGQIAEHLGVKTQLLYNYTHKHPALLRGDPKPQKNPKKSLFTLTEIEVPEGAMVNINTASAKELSAQLGMPMKDAYSITGHRNKHGLFGDIEELLLVNRFSQSKFEMYRDHICVKDVAPTVEVKREITPTPVVKYNVNTASPHDLQKAGFNKTQAFKIVHTRKMKGPFYELDDLLDVDCIKKKDVRKLRDVLEV